MSAWKLTLLQHNKKSQSLPEKLKGIIDPTLKRITHFGHPEIFCWQCLPTAINTCEYWALERMLKCRQIAKVEQNAGEFKILLLHFKVDNYIDLIDWHSVTSTEPPFISDNELKAIILDIPAFCAILKQ